MLWQKHQLSQNVRNTNEWTLCNDGELLTDLAGRVLSFDWSPNCFIMENLFQVPSKVSVQITSQFLLLDTHYKMTRSSDALYHKCFFHHKVLFRFWVIEFLVQNIFEEVQWLFEKRIRLNWFFSQTHKIGYIGIIVNAPNRHRPSCRLHWSQEPTKGHR